MKKALQYLVIHCTATPEGREVSAADIRRWHTAPVSEGGRGWRQVGYTDLFHLDGTVERLVGNTRTHAQRKALECYVIYFHEKHPNVKIVGHRDLPGVRKACPSFDVAAWLKSIGIECPQK